MPVRPKAFEIVNGFP